MQITQSSLSNANEKKFMLINEPSQLLFTKKAPSLEI